MRITIYAKDVELVTGLTPRTARHILAQVRKHYGKRKHQFVTIEEFCHYKGLPVDHITTLLNR